MHIRVSLWGTNELLQLLKVISIITTLFPQCFLRLCDARLSHPNLKDDSTNTAECTETSQSLVRALNLIIMKVPNLSMHKKTIINMRTWKYFLQLSSEANTSLVLSILLQIIFLCIPSSEVTHEKGTNDVYICMYVLYVYVSKWMY